MSGELPSGFSDDLHCLTVNTGNGAVMLEKSAPAVEKQLRGTRTRSVVRRI